MASLIALSEMALSSRHPFTRKPNQIVAGPPMVSGPLLVNAGSKKGAPKTIEMNSKRAWKRKKKKLDSPRLSI
jgi:hypothetical protein